jgi:hypothetical protein
MNGPVAVVIDAEVLGQDLGLELASTSTIRSASALEASMTPD